MQLLHSPAFGQREIRKGRDDGIWTLWVAKRVALRVFIPSRRDNCEGLRPCGGNDAEQSRGQVNKSPLRHHRSCHWLRPRPKSMTSSTGRFVCILRSYLVWTPNWAFKLSGKGQSRGSFFVHHFQVPKSRRHIPTAAIPINIARKPVGSGIATPAAASAPNAEFPGVNVMSSNDVESTSPLKPVQ